MQAIVYLDQLVNVPTFQVNPAPAALDVCSRGEGSPQVEQGEGALWAGVRADVEGEHRMLTCSDSIISRRCTICFCTTLLPPTGRRSTASSGQPRVCPEGFPCREISHVEGSSDFRPSALQQPNSLSDDQFQKYCETVHHLLSAA